MKLNTCTINLIIVLIFGCTFDKTHEKLNNGVKDCDKILFNSLEGANQNKACVYELSLKNMKYEIIPKEVFYFPKLESIDLSFNKIDSLPRKIEKLTELKSISISYGSLKYLPETISALKALESMNLLYNNLETLPEEICALKNLKELNLAGNNIKTLPKCICTMQNLRLLNITFSKSSTHVSEKQFTEMKSCLKNCRTQYGVID